MSRGPGLLQREILRAVGDHPGISSHQLRWMVGGALDRLDGRGVPTAFYKGFLRALHKLSVDDDPLTVRELPYASLADVEHHYPYRTHKANVRRHREAVLPLLVSYANGLPPKFTESESERYVIRQHAFPRGGDDDTRRRWTTARSTWSRIDKSLQAKLKTAVELEAHLALLTKGRQYWASKSGYRLDRTLRSLLRTSGNAVDERIMRGIRKLADEWIPEDHAIRGELKGRLYLLIDPMIRGRPTLQPHAKEWLIKEHPGVLKREFDFEPAPPRATGGLYVVGYGPPSIPGLDHILGHDILKRDAFVFTA